MSTILFHNASILTMDPGQPRAQAVLVRSGRVAWVGVEKDVPARRVDRVIDCGGGTLLPGLTDAHIHLLGYASSLRYLNCGRGAVASIGDIQRLIQARASDTPPGQWVRGRGYDEFHLRERRHPVRADLDAAAPHHPVRLDHRSGHACVLNSRGLEQIGIGPDTADPPAGWIERDESGQPTGLLLEMDSYLSRRMREYQDPQQLRDAVREASQALLKWGVTSLHDASPENDVERWLLLRRMHDDGAVRQRLTVMPGIRYLAKFVEDGWSPGAGDEGIRLGCAKMMVTLTTGALHPSEEEMGSLVADARRSGFPVAVHAVEEEALIAVLGVLLQCGVPQSGAAFAGRIEHCSEATPRVQALLKRTGVAVVTQPGFLYESGERYAAQVPASMQPWLYPLRSLRDLGVPLAAGSDAPVASPDPWRGVYAALTRKDASGLAFHPEQHLSLEEALHLYTAGAATAAGEIERKGTIQPGKLGDLVLLDRDLTEGEPEDVLNTRVVIAMLGGQVVGEG